MTMNHDGTHRQATEARGLRNQIQTIVEKLPPIQYHPRANGEIDYYGASFCIARSLGLEKPLFGRATWCHGWVWYDITSPDILVHAEYRGLNNLVVSKSHADYLREQGFPKAVAVGVPFIYADGAPIERIPDSIILFPKHSTQCATHRVNQDSLPYVEYAKRLKDQFSLVVVSIGYEDVRKGNWINAFEQAGIPWISGAWTHDKNALPRMHALLRHFEYATSNTPGSHFAYAAYCGCKMSFYGPPCDLQKIEFDTHPYYKRYPELAKEFKERDFEAEFQAKFPFFFVEPRRASIQVAWARQALGEDNRRPPEEIAALFEWKIRKLPSGRWTPINKNDALSSEELFAKATARSIVGRHEEAFAITNAIKRRHERMRDVEIIRAKYFLSVNNTHGAREALKEELRHFPDNTQAAAMFQQLGGDALKPHVAKNDAEKEFIDLFNRVRPFTRLSIQRARSLYDLALRVCRENIPGNIVECGVAAGGSTMLLALVIRKHSRIPRKVFAFDTFTGMPDPEDVDTARGVPADETGWGTGTCAAPEEFVREHCRRMGVGDIVETRKGLFDATLPVHRREIGEIAMLHLDADWYSSTMSILDNLFDQLNDRALMQIDDYGAWDGCKKAILDYSAQHDLFFDIQEIDDTGVWCVKPTQTGKRQAGRQAPPRDEAFLDPRPSPEFADLYLVRKGILERLDRAIPLFSGTLLDVGCGQMPYRDHILAHNPRITRYVGLDFASGKYAERKKPDLTWDGRVIPLPDGGADCAMATEVLEHCPDPLPVLKEIRRVLAPGGILFFTVPFLWPIHDAPHDHYRYTPFALERLLAEAGFENARIEALGGWNAALAQMIGLWLRRAPMPGESREQLTRDLFPLYTELVRTDAVPTDFTKNPMVTGLSGTAKAPLARRTLGPGTDGRRVVVVTDQFPVLSQTFILDQMTGLIDRGLAVEHWSMQRMDEPVVHENVRRYGLIEKTRYISLPPESLRGSPMEWTERFLRDNGIADLDDVAAVQVHFGPNFLKLEPLFAAHPGLFAVVSFHGYDGSATFRVKGPDVYAGLFARADMITTPSGYMKDALARHGCPPDKIAVHHYGKDTTAFAPVPREKRSGPVRVLSVARFVEKKGLEYSLAAFATAQAGFDAQYRIVGYGPLEKDLAALARTLGVADKVVFLGQITNDAVRREMAEADIFVLTSVTAANGDQEGVPVSLIEAQALGLPVVSSRHAGIPELVVHGETGFLAGERDVAEITGYLRTLIKNPSIRAAFSANARNRVLREFDLASLNDALAGYLLHRGPGRTPAARPADQGHAEETASRDEPGPDAQDRARYCPICKGRQVRFRSFGNPPRPDALCPDCTSLERHRALWVFLKRHTSLFSSPHLRMLHFAPEACLENRFRQALGKGYLTADLLDPRADVRADITNLRFPDASFDAILCSHVLEHVPDDRAAMRELHRVLDADGVAIVMVPLKGETTEEDLSITDPEERARRYGQSDHVRYYGMDIVDRLRDAGFAVTCIETADICAPKDIERMRLGANRIFVCRKGGRRRTAGPASASGDAPSGHAGRETRTQNLRATAKHWSGSRTAPRTRWWMHPAILRHVNALVCGSPVEGPWAGLERHMRALTNGDGFRRGLSVGCGSASKELHLLQEGIVGHFDLFEVSPERAAAGKAAAGRRGVAGRVVFHVRDAFDTELDDRYDLVYWNNALHHMFDVRQALVWSRERLRPGGWLVMDDYVGATRFQWPDAQLQIASRVRRSLPERLLRDPADPGRLCPKDLTRPSLHSMLAADPSEAADSDGILPALPQVFPGVRIIPTGGVVYNLALKDIIANFGEDDADRLRDLLDQDAELAARGQTQYACAFASKQAAGQA